MSRKERLRSLLQARNFASIYNIIQYGGQLKQAPGTIFSTAPTISGLPAGSDYTLDIVAPAGGSPGMIRLLNYDPNSGELAQYWNGGAAAPDYTSSPLTGGSGTWNASIGTGPTRPDRIRPPGLNLPAISRAVRVGPSPSTGHKSFDKLYFSAQTYTLTGGSLKMSPRTRASGEIKVDTVTGDNCLRYHRRRERPSIVKPGKNVDEKRLGYAHIRRQQELYRCYPRSVAGYCSSATE